jgi:hypothetical protein
VYANTLQHTASLCTWQTPSVVPPSKSSPSVAPLTKPFFELQENCLTPLSSRWILQPLPSGEQGSLSVSLSVCRSLSLPPPPHNHPPPPPFGEPKVLSLSPVLFLFLPLFCLVSLCLVMPLPCSLARARARSLSLSLLLQTMASDNQGVYLCVCANTQIPTWLIGYRGQHAGACWCADIYTSHIKHIGVT